LDQSPSEDEALTRAASFLAQALRELQRDSDASARHELAESRQAVQQLAQHLEQQLAQEQQQRVVLATQLTGLASALDRLVSHLGGLSQLMAGLLERLSQSAPAPATAAATQAAEPSFPAGGEGISLTLAGVSGFQALMDIQKALTGLDQVVSASVERFQEGDSRVLVLLSAPATANDLASGIHHATGQTVVVEESRPELQRLRLKIVPSS
jgi:exonuclease VII large subunit